jgi:MoaA/NifB/PqqE/SkfB family radical SAM enzyme
MFCHQPFNHIDVIIENDEIVIQPCNVWSGKKFSLQEYQDEISDIKNTLQTTYHKGCSVCHLEDTKNIRSRRVAMNEFSQDNKLSTDRLQSLGIRYGTLCNSKCMICNHTRSSSWVADAEKLGIKVQDRYKYKKNKLPSVDFFFDSFDLDDLRFVEFHGGEPLMQDNPVEFLSKVKHLDKLIVKFNTNLTILPSPELQQLLTKCKRVDMLLSVDDIENRYSILRYPGKWNMFTENLHKIKSEGYRTMAYNTISSLNVFYMPEFYRWAVKNFGTEVHSQFVVDKHMLDISYLSTHAKDAVFEKIKNYKGKIFDSIRAKLKINNQNRSKELLNYIQSLDKIRKTNYPDTFNEWWQILNA